ncbi:16S rRNA (cytidine(1402)-2'-O)-methyltransferase [candidate division WWE3 bacterium]|nr:16S rRNA (cytidine(1402)-2'-O)-methyltransferase [candidate division WWE3 bacterium]
MPTLYLISTPIGNLEDITIRAIRTIWSVDILLCEDTRETKKLLDTYSTYQQNNHMPRLLSYNDFNRDRRIPEVLAALQQGLNVGLVSDRGTPLVSDPGYNLVREVIKLSQLQPEITIDAIPGANALLPALQLSGLPPDKFTFLGFLPKKRGRKEELLHSLSPMTWIMYESPHRLVESLQELYEILGEQRISVSIELTKMFQHTYRGLLSESIEYFTSHPPRGEVSMVVSPLA